jgi:two-component sensor histidine kinase
VNVNILGRAGETAYGILEVDSREPRRFSDGDVDFLRTYSNLVAAAVERLRAFDELRLRAEEKERLFAELQHRVKNNMQVITSLIRIQTGKASTPEAQDELRKIGGRIDTLRIIHEKLHDSGQVEAIDAGSYLAELSATLIKFHTDADANVRLVTDLEPFSATPEVAVPLGLIANEFITNSLKYAFGSGGGEIGVRLRRTEGGPVCVKLWDDGKGLPAERAGGTGMYLIEGLSRQVASEIAWGDGPGTQLRLTLK